MLHPCQLLPGRTTRTEPQVGTWWCLATPELAARTRALGAPLALKVAGDKAKAGACPQPGSRLRARKDFPAVLKPCQEWRGRAPWEAQRVEEEKSEYVLHKWNAPWGA